MNGFFIVLLVLVVAVVAVDALARLDERRRPPKPSDPIISTTQKIIVDLTKRR
jgi:hypothetical protein